MHLSETKESMHSRAQHVLSFQLKKSLVRRMDSNSFDALGIWSSRKVK